MRLAPTMLVEKITRGHAVAVLTDRGPWSEARAAQPENGRSDSARRVPYM
jgi:hypothetical protein